MSTIDKAIELAAKAHAGVKDKQGQPYLLHTIRVMLGGEGETAQIVAVLHDVSEDSDVSLDDIRAAGFSQAVLDALDLVTHRPSQTYSDYVVACKQNQDARQVKIADLRDNSSLARLLLRPERFQGDSARMHRYVLSHRFLTDELTEDEYRRLMVDFEQ